MNRKMRGNLMLLLTALILGSSYVALDTAMEYVGPFTFTAIRYLIGGTVLIPVSLLLVKKSSSNSAANEISLTEEERKAKKKVLLQGGIVCGSVAFIACTFQQIGIVYTTAGKAGFITTLYIVIVPIMGILIGKKVRPIVWLCIGLSIVGVYLLCMKDGLSIGKGDLLVLLGAFAFAAYILVVDHFSSKTDGVKLSCITFFVCGCISLIPTFIFETLVLSDILDCWLPILYVGVINCGVALTLQIVAQRDTNPTTASLLLGLESVFALIFGVIILQEQVTPRELVGCVLMFSAIVIAQLPTKEERLADTGKTEWAKLKKEEKI